MSGEQLAHAWRHVWESWPGRCPPPWASVRGPVGAAARELARVGWRFESAVCLVTARGARVDLTRTSAADLRGMLVTAQERLFKAVLAVKRGVEGSWSLEPLAALTRRRRFAEKRALLLAWRGGGPTDMGGQMRDGIRGGPAMPVMWSGTGHLVAPLAGVHPRGGGASEEGRISTCFA